MNRSSAAGALEWRATIPRRPGVFQRLLRFSRAKPLGAFGGALVLALIFMALFASLISPHDPYRQVPGATLRPPSAENLMGTDKFGRDVFSRIIFGARTSLTVGVVAVGIGCSIGYLLGVFGAYIGGASDNILQRAVDSLMAFPLLILALAITAALGPSLFNVTVAIGVVLAARTSRVARSVAMTVKESQYIDAARAIGCDNSRIMLRHLLPNCLAPYIVIISLEIGHAIVIEASLSFLGMGVPPAVPSWGSMLTDASRGRLMEVAPWLAIFPGVCLSLTVFGCNLLGDAMRDVLDPRLRRG